MNQLFFRYVHYKENNFIESSNNAHLEDQAPWKMETLLFALAVLHKSLNRFQMEGNTAIYTRNV